MAAQDGVDDVLPGDRLLTAGLHVLERGVLLADDRDVAGAQRGGLDAQG